MMEAKEEPQPNENTPGSLNENVKGEMVMQSIHLSEDKLGRMLHLSGVFCDGTQYYDLKNVLYVNNTGLANFIDLLKALLKKGAKLQFVNVNDKIKEKIKSVGLDRVLNCS